MYTLTHMSNVVILYNVKFKTTKDKDNREG